MKKQLSVLLMLLISCGPSEVAIEERIEEAVSEATSTTSSSTSTTSSTTTTTTTTTTLPPRYGVWTVETSKSALDDSVSFYGFVDSIKPLKSKYDETIPRLVVRCRSGEYDMYVDTGHILTPYYDGDIGEVLARIRLGLNEPKTIVVEEGADSEVVFFRSPELLIGYLTTVDKVLFEITPYDSNTDYAEFEIDGVYNLIFDMQKDCRSKKVNVGLYAADANISVDKLITAGADYFWQKDSDGDEYALGFAGGFGNSEFSPVRIRMQGNWSDSEKTEYQNKVLSTFASVIHIDFVDGDADIIFHADQSSAENNYGESLSDREYGALLYWGEFNYCEAFVRDSAYIPIYIFGCLGNNEVWGRNLGVSSSFSQDTFVEGELYVNSSITKVDLAILGLVYHNSPLTVRYSKDAYKTELGEYTP